VSWIFDKSEIWSSATTRPSVLSAPDDVVRFDGGRLLSPHCPVVRRFHSSGRAPVDRAISCRKGAGNEVITTHSSSSSASAAAAAVIGRQCFGESVDTSLMFQAALVLFRSTLTTISNRFYGRVTRRDWLSGPYSSIYYAASRCFLCRAAQNGAYIAHALSRLILATYIQANTTQKTGRTFTR